MTSNPVGYGNCPVCRLAVMASKARGLTPKHGHIKTAGRRGENWLPPCPGSGQKALNIQVRP